MEKKITNMINNEEEYQKFLINLITLFTLFTFYNIYIIFNRKKKPILISIDGNIGTGKSTFTNLLKENISNAEYLQEPVDVWLNIKDSKGVNILQKFYEDKSRWSYTFQNIAFITRMKLILDKVLTSSKDFIISDRCMETDKQIFAKILRNDNLLNDIEWKLYNMWNDIYEKYFSYHLVRNIIYLRCDPQISMERIKKRNRGEENTITIEYLKKIHNAHEEWLMDKYDEKINVLVINCNDDF